MKILLADDHALIRSGLRNELSDLAAGIDFLEAWDVESLQRMFEAHADLDLALIDLAMPGMDGAKTIGLLRQRYPAIPLVVVSGADPGTDAHAVIRAGAAGFIPKTAMAKIMLQAIRLVLAGGRYLPPELMKVLDPNEFGSGAEELALVRDAARRHAADGGRLDQLSQRQREVFSLLAKGLSNKMIARQLNVTEGTVKSHVATIFDILKVHNRVSAVAAARDGPGGPDDRRKLSD
jgi:DNA-binding NarL/FixJ family response regulator